MYIPFKIFNDNFSVVASCLCCGGLSTSVYYTGYCQYKTVQVCVCCEGAFESGKQRLII